MGRKNKSKKGNNIPNTPQLNIFSEKELKKCLVEKKVLDLLYEKELDPMEYYSPSLFNFN